MTKKDIVRDKRQATSVVGKARVTVIVLVIVIARMPVAVAG